MDLSEQWQYNLTNIIIMGYIQIYASVLSNFELAKRLKQDREK